MNQACSSLNGGSLEKTTTVPFKGLPPEMQSVSREVKKVYVKKKKGLLSLS